jgi:hypothetical protein
MRRTDSDAKLFGDSRPGHALLTQGGNSWSIRDDVWPPEVLAFGSRIPESNLTRSTISERSSSATAPSTVNTILPAGVAVSIASLRDTKWMPNEPNVARVINAAPYPFKVMFLVAAICGLRIGEVTALKVGSLDFKRKLLYITAALDYATRKESTPKSHNSEAPPVNGTSSRSERIYTDSKKTWVRAACQTDRHKQLDYCSCIYKNLGRSKTW